MPGAEVLFGGRVKAEALEALASTPKPLTGYRVAKIVGAQPIQVQNILKSLSPQFVQRTNDGWIMVDDSLRLFLRHRVSQRERRLRLEKDRVLSKLGLKPRNANGRDQLRQRNPQGS